jgi:hypothetical protein
MGTISYRTKTAASEVQFFRNLDLSAADFDGTDKASMAAGMLDPTGYNRWAEGFYFCPEVNGDVEVLSWVDYIQNGKVIDDSYKQIIPSCAAGIFHPTRVVKVYYLATTSSSMAIGV